MDVASIKVPWEPGLDLGARFVRPWTPVRRSVMYQLSLLLVAGVMVLIPIVYAAMIAGVGYLTWWHATHNLDAFLPHSDPTMGSTARMGRRGRALAFFIFVGYLGPIAVGLFVILSMLKPLVVPRGRERENVLVDAANEPVLYAFVTRMCEVMGAPAPSRIEVDATINASAGTRGGLIGAMFSRDLVLTIGLPLVTGMRLNELAGILAHELGHFCQGAGMRASYLISSVQTWLAHAVYRRDRLDWWIHDLSAANHSLGIGLVLGAARLCAWIARGVLWVMLMGSHVLTLWMSRQMEHDADRHESRFSGSEAMVSAMRRLEELGVAQDAAMEEVQDHFRNNELPDDLPALIADAAGRVSAETKEKVQERLERERSAWFSSHPPTIDRIRRAMDREDPGVFSADVPARVLFKDLRGLCVRATRLRYRREVGGEAEIARSVSAADLLRVNAKHTARVGEASAFLGFEAPDWRPMFPVTAEIGPAEDVRAAVGRLKDARAKVRAAAASAGHAAKSFRMADAAVVKCEQGLAHIEAGLGKPPKELELEAKTREGVLRLMEGHKAAAAEAAAILDEALDAGSARLVWALRVLLAPGGERVVARGAALAERARVLYPVLMALRGSLGEVRAVRSELARASVIAGGLESTRTRDKVKGVLRPLADVCRDTLAKIRSGTGAVKYPFENPTGEITLAARLVDDTPAWRDFDAIFRTADRCVSRYPEEVRRVLGELAGIARAVEESLERRAREKGAGAGGAAGGAGVSRGAEG